MQVIRAANLPLSRWTNGAGRKADILTGAGWLIGFAWLDADAPFSRLAGMDRTITLVEGPGFTLDVVGDVETVAMPVMTPFVPTHFDGGADTLCRVVGPCRVLNAMTDRTRFRHAVTILDRSQRVDPGPNRACVVVALNGTFSLGAGQLERLDAASITEPVELGLPSGCRAALITVDDAV